MTDQKAAADVRNDDRAQPSAERRVADHIRDFVAGCPMAGLLSEEVQRPVPEPAAVACPDGLHAARAHDAQAVQVVVDP